MVNGLFKFHKPHTFGHAGKLQSLLWKILSNLQALDCPSQASKLIEPVNMAHMILVTPMP